MALGSLGVPAGLYAGLDTLAPLTRPQRPSYTLVATFQSGHGWTDVGGTSGGAMADDTSVYEYGTQSLKLTVPAQAASNRSTRKTGLTSTNLTAKNFAVFMMVDAPTNLGDIRLTLADDGTFTNYTQYVAAYGNSNADVGTLRANEWQWVHFTKAEQIATAGTGGLTAVTVWQLRVNGSASSIINAWFGAAGYYTPATSYPNGVVSFCCDDSYASQFTRLAPALDKYGYAATCFNIVDLVDTAGRLTTDQLNKLHDQHGWEISAHAATIANHNQTNGFQDLTEAQLETELKALRAWTARGGWRGGDLLAYPKGKDNALVRKVAGKYFAAGRLVARQPYQTVRADGRGLRLRSYSVDAAATSAATLTALIDSAYTNGWWLIITLHDVTASGASAATEWDVSKVQTVVDYCNTKPIPVRLIGEVLTAD